MSPILYVLIFVAVVLAVEGIYFLLLERRSDEAEVRKRLQGLAGNLQAPGSGQENTILRGDEQRSLVDSLLEAIPKFQGLELRLYRAGLTMKPHRFMFLSAAVGAGAWLLATVFFQDPLRAIPAVLAGLLPYVQIGRMANKRLLAFESQFPEALELLTRAMRAGHSFTFGMQIIGDEMPDPVGTEFAQVAEEIKLGKDAREALVNLAYRINTPDLPFFITAISIQSSTGGNLAEILDKLGYVIRERFKLYGKVRALTAIGRLSANLLACWPLVMVGALYMVSPDYIAPLWTSETGPLLILISSVLVVIGYIICRRMATIEV
jgi:tight adherence protein B